MSIGKIRMSNLYEELIETLDENEKKIKDIKWIQVNNKEIDINTFLEISKKINYDAGYGAVKINSSLLIAGENWWLERREYDGSEWFEFKQIPIKPKKKIEKNIRRYILD